MSNEKILDLSALLEYAFRLSRVEAHSEVCVVDRLGPPLSRDDLSSFRVAGWSLSSIAGLEIQSGYSLSLYFVVIVCRHIMSL